MKPPKHRTYKLTPERARLMVECARLNMSVAGMCQRVGISQMTYYRWRDSEVPELVQLFADMERARGDWEARQLATIEKAAQAGNWTAAAWSLERRRPDVYGRRHKVDAKIETSEAGALKDATDSQLAAALRELGVEDDVPNPEADSDDEG